MNRNRLAGSLAMSLVVIAAPQARAEVKVQEKTHVKFGGALGTVVGVLGGKSAKEGITSSVALSGNRRLKTTGDTGEIVDLSEEKVYDIDFKEKTYKVTTFAELRRRMQEEEEKAARQTGAREESPEAAADDAPAEASRDRQEEPHVEVDFNVKETGQRKPVNGFDARQVIATVVVREKGKTLEQSGGLLITSDMWLGPGDAGARELAAFEQRYFEKLHGPAVAAAARAQMATLTATYPGLKEALGRLQTEGARMDGVPVLTTTTIEAVKSPQQMAQLQQAQEEEKPKGLGGMLGRKLKIGPKDQPAGGAANRSMLMTTTHEILGVSSAVGAADVALPAGFRQQGD